MSFNKNIFFQFGKIFKKETDKYEAYEEKRLIDFPKCDHKNSKVVNGELRCPCGAAWRGPRIIDLLNYFKKEKKWKTKKKK